MNPQSLERHHSGSFRRDRSGSIERSKSPVARDKVETRERIEERNRRKRVSVLSLLPSSPSPPRNQLNLSGHEDEGDASPPSPVYSPSYAAISRSVGLGHSFCGSPLIPRDPQRFPRSFVLAQVRKAEDNTRDSIFESQLLAADELFLLMKKEEVRIRHMLRQRQLDIENVERKKKAERERQLALRRRVLNEEELERQIAERIEQRAFEDLKRMDVQLRQRRQTLHNLKTKRRKEKKRKQALETSQQQLGKEDVFDMSAVPVDDDQDVIASRLRVVQRKARQNEKVGCDPHTTAVFNASSLLQHSSILATQTQGISPMMSEYYLTSSVRGSYLEYSADPKHEWKAIAQHVAELHGEQQLTFADDERPPCQKEVKDTISEEEKQWQERQREAALRIQRVGRGLVGRIHAGAFRASFVVRSRRVSCTSTPQLRPLSGQKRASLSVPTTPQGRPISAGSRRSSRRPTSASSRSSAECLRSGNDRMVRTLKKRRKRLFPELTVPPEFDDLYEQEEKEVRDYLRRKEKEAELQQEREELQHRFKLPEHSKIYDAKEQSDIRAKLATDRERRLKGIRDETWHHSNRLRIDMSRKLEVVKQAGDRLIERAKFVGRKRDKARKERLEEERKSWGKEQRRLYILQEQHDIQALELHIKLREDFMRESRVAALQKSLVEVPGAARIAAMTSALSVDKARRSESVLRNSQSLAQLEEKEEQRRASSALALPSTTADP